MHLRSVNLLARSLFYVCMIPFIKGRSLSWYLKGKNPELQTIFKRDAFNSEPICPMFAGLFPGNDYYRKNKLCSPEYYSCSGDDQCGPGLKCCFDGCIYFCTLPLKRKGLEAIDWIQEPRSQRISGDSWLEMNEASIVPTHIECSTSNFAGFMPMGCPSGYKCIIEKEEDKENQIPNRGVCISNRKKGLNSIERGIIWEKEPTPRRDCTYKGKRYKHGHYFLKGCNFCFCDSGVVQCQLSPCPSVAAEKKTSKDTSENNPLSQIDFRP